jgi:hypothetical protein
MLLKLKPCAVDRSKQKLPTGGFILHGALVGVVATLLYVAPTLARPEPFAYLVAHGLKILKGAGGSFVSGRRRSPAAATE